MKNHGQLVRALIEFYGFREDIFNILNEPILVILNKKLPNIAVYFKSLYGKQFTVKGKYHINSTTNLVRGINK